MNALRLFFASSIAASLSVVFVVLITITAELNAPLKGLLTNLTGHHWVSKSILSFALYLAVLFLGYLFFRNVDARKVHRGIVFVLWSAVIGTAAILFFYTGHHVGWY